MEDTIWSCIEHNVTLKLVENRIVKGIIGCVDPESYTIVLVHTENEQDRQFSIIPLHAVVECERGIKCTQLPDWFVAHCSPTKKTIDEDVVDKRRRQLVEILNKHRLKFKIDDTDKTVSVLDGAAKIRAPYTVDDCDCDNAIVMRRVTELIKTIEQ